MLLSRNMVKATGIAIILLFASASLATMIAEAQQGGSASALTEQLPGGSILLPAGVTPDVTYPTLPYISFRPNPIGLGQPLLVNVWMIPPLHVARYFKQAFEVTLTKPDGTTDKVGPLSSYYGDGTAWFEYTVDQIGTWKIKFDFLGAYFPAGNYTSLAAYTINQTLVAKLGVYYAPSTDGPYEFVVQQDVVRAWPGSPLPTDYWTRPVSLENREWWPILGSYPPTGTVGGGPDWPAETNTYMSNYMYIPYVQGPKSAHIVWKRQGTLSGLFGGNLGQISSDARPEGPDIIYNGRCYQTVAKIVNGVETEVWQCYDLRTGEIYWEKTGIPQPPTIVSYVANTESTVPGEEARHRGLAVELLYVGNRVIAYDPWIGSVIYNISIAPLTSATYYSNPSQYLSVQNLGSGKGYRLINWTVTGDVSYPDLINRRVGVISNITWPFSSLGVVDYEAGIAVNTQGITPPSTGVSYGQMIMAASLTTGALLWNITTDVSKGSEGFFSGSTRIADHGKFAVLLNDGHFHCWDLLTGKKLWVSELSSHPWGIWGIYGISSAYGLMIYPQYDGVVAYDWDTGKIVWRYQYIAQFPWETVYSDGNYPFRSDICIADGVVYAANDEHSVSNPIPRGYKLHAINATTGKGIWNVSLQAAPRCIADGYLAVGNRDGYMYVFGKGKSATTVTAPDVKISKGSGVVIKGTVIDQSPGQPGTPCVSRDSMATQMEYLHLQHPIDGVAHDIQMTGVPVSLTAIAADGSFIDLGTVTTDAYYGTFSKSWTPDKEGDYKIIASFTGDESYGSSAASTSVSVGPAAAEITIPEQTQPPDYTMTIIGVGIAIMIVVVLSVAIAVLMLRKR